MPMSPAGLPDGLIIDWLHGEMPTEGEGTMMGFPFYFRAKWGEWSLHVVPPGHDPMFWEDLSITVLHEAGGPDLIPGRMKPEDALPIIRGEFAKFLPKFRARIIPERPPERHTRHQVARTVRADLLRYGAMHLYRDVPALRLTYQIRHLTWMAIRDWSALEIHVDADTRISDALQAHVAAQAQQVRIERDVRNPHRDKIPPYLRDGWLEAEAASSGRKIDEHFLAMRERARNEPPVEEFRGRYFAVFADEDTDDEVDGLEVAHFQHADKHEAVVVTMFTAFTDAVVAHGEDGLRGSRFPLLTEPALLEGAWSAGRCPTLCRNLEEIGKIFAALPAPTGRALHAFSEHLGRTPRDLGECFVDVDREPLIEGLLELARTAVRVGRPIEFQ